MCSLWKFVWLWCVIVVCVCVWLWCACVCDCGVRVCVIVVCDCGVRACMRVCSMCAHRLVFCKHWRRSVRVCMHVCVRACSMCAYYGMFCRHWRRSAQRGSVKTRMARRHYCKLQNTTLVLPKYFVYMYEDLSILHSWSCIYIIKERLET